MTIWLTILAGAIRPEADSGLTGRSFPDSGLAGLTGLGRASLPSRAAGCARPGRCAGRAAAAGSGGRADVDSGRAIPGRWRAAGGLCRAGAGDGQAGRSGGLLRAALRAADLAGGNDRQSTQQATPGPRRSGSGGLIRRDRRAADLAGLRRALAADPGRSGAMGCAGDPEAAAGDLAGCAGRGGLPRPEKKSPGAEAGACGARSTGARVYRASAEASRSAQVASSHPAAKAARVTAAESAIKAGFTARPLSCARPRRRTRPRRA